jgi:putative nucleotidyltransferase with HDIG domain
MKLRDWQNELIKHGELYCVGGSVRDQLLGLAHAEEDVDYLIRGISPDKLEQVLSRFGRVVLVGRSFGVYKFKPSGGAIEYDIAFPRKEVSTGPGHREFDIDWATSLAVEEDLGRRDFTMNAIARNVADGNLVDPFAGRRDIENRRLRMIFPQAFREDSLRILRGIRFATRFSLVIEPETEQAMKVAASLLAKLSAERVQDEFNKIFSQCDRPSEAMALMHELDVLGVVLPELARTFGVAQNEYHPDDVFWHSLKSCDGAPRGNVLLRWAALLHDIGKVDAKRIVDEEDSPPRVVFYGHEQISAEVARTVLGRLRYSNDFVKRCTHLIRHHMYFYQPEWNRSTVRRFIRTVGAENLEDLFVLRKADLMSRDLGERACEVDELRRRVREEIEAEHALKIEDMEIDGRDVMAVLGIAGGTRVGSVLRAVFDRVLENPALNQRDRLLEMLKEYKEGEG